MSKDLKSLTGEYAISYIRERLHEYHDQWGKTANLAVFVPPEVANGLKSEMDYYSGRNDSSDYGIQSDSLASEEIDLLGGIQIANNPVVSDSAIDKPTVLPVNLPNFPNEKLITPNPTRFHVRKCIQTSGIDYLPELGIYQVTLPFVLEKHEVELYEEVKSASRLWYSGRPKFDYGVTEKVETYNTDIMDDDLKITPVRFNCDDRFDGSNVEAELANRVVQFCKELVVSNRISANRRREYIWWNDETDRFDVFSRNDPMIVGVESKWLAGLFLTGS